MNVIIITGASSGMGAEFAFQLDYSVGNIDEIWLIARRREAMLEVAQNMEHTTRVLDMDITNAAHIARFKNVLEKDKPVIRMLVNCAGCGVMGQFAEKQPNHTACVKRGIYAAAGICGLRGIKGVCIQLFTRLGQRA